MQLSFCLDSLPVGYVRFYPDVPTEILLALGGMQALEKVGAHDLLSSGDSLEFSVLPQFSKVRQVHITKNLLGAFDMHFYDNGANCLASAYHVSPKEAPGIFRAETGLVSRRNIKYAQIDPSVCYEEAEAV